MISSYFSMSINAIRYFFELGKRIQDVKVSLERILVIINTQASKYDGDMIIDSIEKIEVKRLSFGFTEEKIIKELSIEFRKGYSYAIVGANGSGKTTLIYLLLGLYEDFEGEILFNEVKINDINLDNLREFEIGVVEQEPELLTDTIQNNFWPNKSAKKNKDYHNEVYKLLWDKELNINSEIYENANNLSGGEKQRIALIRALAKNPDLIVLDEPTSAIDISGRERLTELVNTLKKDKIIIIVTHEKKIADVCDYRIVMD
ncbi:ABC-type bacteriocin/lantibiotic exporter with double-glycine peptidase domain [Lachnospiraceae bacterium PF1-21]